MTLRELLKSVPENNAHLYPQAIDRLRQLNAGLLPPTAHDDDADDDDDDVDDDIDHSSDDDADEHDDDADEHDDDADEDGDAGDADAPEPSTKHAAEDADSVADEDDYEVDELLLGHNCCAVCAEPSSDSSVKCPRCQSITYCHEEHLKQDYSIHNRVCPILRRIHERDHAASSSSSSNSASSMGLPAATEDLAARLSVGISDLLVGQLASAASKSARGRRRAAPTSPLQRTKKRVAKLLRTNEFQTDANSDDGSSSDDDDEEDDDDDDDDEGNHKKEPELWDQVFALTPGSHADPYESDELQVTTAMLSFPLTIAHAAFSHAPLTHWSRQWTTLLRLSDAAQPLVVHVIGDMDRYMSAKAEVWLSAAAGLYRCAAAGLQSDVADKRLHVSFVFFAENVPEALDSTTVKHTPTEGESASAIGSVSLTFHRAPYTAASLLSLYPAPTSTSSSTSTSTSPLSHVRPHLVVAYNLDMAEGEHVWSPRINFLKAAFAGSAPVLMVSSTKEDASRDKDVLVHRKGLNCAIDPCHNPAKGLLPRQSTQLANDVRLINPYLTILTVPVPRSHRE